MRPFATLPIFVALLVVELFAIVDDHGDVSPSANSVHLICPNAICPILQAVNTSELVADIDSS